LRTGKQRGTGKGEMGVERGKNDGRDGCGNGPADGLGEKETK